MQAVQTPGSSTEAAAEPSVAMESRRHFLRTCVFGAACVAAASIPDEAEASIMIRRRNDSSVGLPSEEATWFIGNTGISISTVFLNSIVRRVCAWRGCQPTRTTAEAEETPPIPGLFITLRMAAQELLFRGLMPRMLGSNVFTWCTSIFGFALSQDVRPIPVGESVEIRNGLHLRKDVNWSEDLLLGSIQTAVGNTQGLGAAFFTRGLYEVQRQVLNKLK